MLRKGQIEGVNNNNVMKLVYMTWFGHGSCNQNPVMIHGWIAYMNLKKIQWENASVSWNTTNRKIVLQKGQKFVSE